MASIRETIEKAQAAKDWRRDRLAKLPPAGATSLDSTPDYAHNEQVLWSEVQGGFDRFYCHDDRARLRWRVTPNNDIGSHWPTHIPGVGGWLLRLKNRLLVTATTIYKLPEDAL